MKKTLFVGDIVIRKTAISSLKNAKGLSAATTKNIRKITKQLSSEIDEFEEMKTDKIKEIGVRTGDTVVIKPGTPQHTEIANYTKDLFNVKVDIDIQNPINVDEFYSTTSGICDLSAAEIEDLIFLGVVYDEEDKKEEEKPKTTPSPTTESTDSVLEEKK